MDRRKNRGNAINIHITLTSWWERWRIESTVSPLFTQPFIQARIKINIKAPRYWPLCGEFAAQMAGNAENGSIWLRHLTYKNASGKILIEIKLNATLLVGVWIRKYFVNSAVFDVHFSAIEIVLSPMHYGIQRNVHDDQVYLTCYKVSI